MRGRLPRGILPGLLQVRRAGAFRLPRLELRPGRRLLFDEGDDDVDPARRIERLQERLRTSR
jgi:hypothetical protein